MHRFRAFLLAAAVGAGLPALAVAQDYQRGGPDRQDRQPRGERSAERGDRPQAAPQPAPQAQSMAQPAPQPQPAPRSFERPQRPDLQAQAPAQADRQRRFDRGDRPAGVPDARPTMPGFDPAQRGRGYGDDRREAAQGRPGFDQGRQAFDRDRQPFDRGRPGFADDRRDGRETRDGYARNDGRFDPRGGNRGWQAPGPSGRISADWRRDQRFDWRGYRDTHRSTFRIGRYAAPRGYNYGYRPFSIGFRIAPYFYASNYWIDDPYAYRLPPVWGSYRWVRYYDDVLLIDLATGEIVDAIQGFFW